MIYMKWKIQCLYLLVEHPLMRPDVYDIAEYAVKKVFEYL